MNLCTLLFIVITFRVILKIMEKSDKLYVLSTHRLCKWKDTEGWEDKMNKWGWKDYKGNPISEESKNRIVEDFSRRRTPGIFTSFKEAKQVIEDNDGDILENNYYNVAVISEITPGLYMLNEKCTFYAIWCDNMTSSKEDYIYTDKNGEPHTMKEFHSDYHYKRIKRPECWENVVGICGIG